MRFPTVARSLASGVLVYILAAACASGEKVAFVLQDGAAPGSSGSVGDAVGAVGDAIANPVGEAAAADPTADVAEEPCIDNGNTQLYATHLYPGKSVQDLAELRAVFHVKDGQRPTVGGSTFEYFGATPYLHEGAATVLCGTTSFASYDKVMFIMPQ